MIRYSYNQQLTPPAPFVHVTVRPPKRGIAVSDSPALLDTAADNEPYVLLVRDVLNDYRAILDGPLLRLEIE